MIAVLNDFIGFGKKLVQDIKFFPNLSSSLKSITKLAFFSATVHSIKQLSELVKYLAPSGNRSYDFLKQAMDSLTKATDISAIILAFAVAIKYLFSYISNSRMATMGIK